MNQEDRINHFTKEFQSGQESKFIYDGVKAHLNFYRAELFDAFSKSGSFAKKKREEIYRQIKAVDTFEARLLELIKTGNMAKEEISLIQEMKDTITNTVGNI